MGEFGLSKFGCEIRSGKKEVLDVCVWQAYIRGKLGFYKGPTKSFRIVCVDQLQSYTLPTGGLWLCVGQGGQQNKFNKWLYSYFRVSSPKIRKRVLLGSRANPLPTSRTMGTLCVCVSGVWLLESFANGWQDYQKLILLSASPYAIST